MIRGTTPTHTFTLPFAADILSAVHVIYAQGGAVKFKKTAADCQLDRNTITVKLTQKETLAFSDGQLVEIQIRALDASGNSIASDIMRVHVCRCLEDEVLA